MIKRKRINGNLESLILIIIVKKDLQTQMVL